jgi:cytochrome c-type biogenesis protein CcmH/NrfG
VRATLHDELMREAGFETDYHRELARRHEERRQRVRSARHRILVLWYRALLLLCLAVATADLFGLVHYVPKRVAGVATVVAVLVLRADDFGLRAPLRRLGLIAEDSPRESRVARSVRWLRGRLRREPEPRN